MFVRLYSGTVQWLGLPMPFTNLTGNGADGGTKRGRRDNPVTPGQIGTAQRNRRLETTVEVRTTEVLFTLARSLFRLGACDLRGEYDQRREKEMIRAGNTEPFAVVLHQRRTVNSRSSIGASNTTAEVRVRYGNRRSHRHAGRQRGGKSDYLATSWRVGDRLDS